MNQMKSLYIHFPFCKHLCNYCDFYKHKLTDNNQILDFERQLSAQIDLHEIFLKKNNIVIEELDTIYIGGGTPSLWKVNGVNFLKKFFIEKNIKLSKKVEFTIEVDPDTWNEEEIEAWLGLGVNRFSIGSQAFTEELLLTMDRTHSLDDVEKTLKFMSERKLNFSVDLMLGLPNSKDRNIKNELDRILKYNPNHLSVYILKARKKYPLITQMPDDENIRNEYLQVSEHLVLNKYVHYEVSNFARDDHFSEHNLKYWEYSSVGALGANATGLIVKKNQAIRYHWKSLAIGYVTEEITGESLIIEKVFLGLRNFKGINLKEFFCDVESHKSIDLLFVSWKKSGYLTEESSANWTQLNALGYLMCDSLLDDIFKYIKF
jgi:oxygen-independent coproporphyrinogen-3 oxidase